MGEKLRSFEITQADLIQLATESRLYVVLDSCDSPEIFAKVQELGDERAHCLYRGEISKDVQETAPYLAMADAPLVTWIAETLREQPWGIFVAMAAQADIRKLRKHLRKFLVVQSPNGEPLYFRYYDPRILPTFLAECNASELAEIYGPILAFGIYQRRGQPMLLTRA